MKIALVFLFLLTCSFAFAQEVEIKNYSANKVNDLNITIDGVLNEAEWQTANWENQFIQHAPYEGKAPHQQTFLLFWFFSRALPKQSF